MWYKNFRNRKLQTFLVGIIILLCALLISTSTSIFLSLREPMEQLITECQSADALVYPNEREYPEKVMEVAKRLEALDEVDRAICLQVHYVTEKMTSKEKEIITFTNLTKYDAEVFGKIRTVEGNAEDFQNLEEGECIIPACISVDNHLKLGDEFTIHFPEKEVTYTIKGIYADIYATSNAFGNYILVKELPSQLPEELMIRFYTTQSFTEEQILDRYEETYGHALEGQMNTKENAMDGALRAVQILGGILLAIGVIMLFTCCLIINFVLRSIMTSDAKNIAIYKTIGYDNHTIRNLYEKFFIVLTTISVWFGVGASSVVADQILNDLFANIGMQANVRVGKTGLAIYAGILLLVLATVHIVTGRMKHMKPVHALGGVSPTNTTKNQHYRGNLKFAFSPLGIASRMIMRDKKGTIGILFVAIVVVIGINFGLVSLDVALHMKDNNDYWLGIDKSDIIITVSGTASTNELVEKLNQDENIEKAVPCRMSGNLVVEREKNNKDAVVYPFVYEDYSEVDLPIVLGRNPENGKEIALAGKIAETLHKEIGDYITLHIGEGTKSFLITGLYQTYYNMGESCRLTKSAYEGYEEFFSFDTVSVYLHDDQDIDGEVERIEQLINGSGNVIPRTEQFASIMEMISEPQESAIPIVIVMVVLIGSINIFCIILLKNQKDVKVNSIYKCLGYTSGHLMTANVCYVSLIAIASILVAVPILLKVYPVIMKLALGTMFGLLEYRVQYNMAHVIFANIVIFGLFMFSTFLSSGGIRKIHVRDLVIE